MVRNNIVLMGNVPQKKTQSKYYLSNFDSRIKSLSVDMKLDEDLQA